ncbi:MAG: flagellar basal body-associated FliL family protein [Gemmataceae bacterium]|nr:flagellar basal body-associated FliL family protein [Gemmataceae bacterium]
MSAVAPAAATPASPAKPRRGKLPLIVVSVLAVGGGVAVPMFVNVPALLGKEGHGKAKPKHGSDLDTVSVPFGDVVVNLSEDRMSRYLRVKIALKVDGHDEKATTALVTKHKAAMKSKIIGHLAGKGLKDVGGSVGIAKLQREILEKFDDILYPDGDSHLKEVLFEEFVVQ